MLASAAGWGRTVALRCVDSRFTMRFPQRIATTAPATHHPTPVFLFYTPPAG